MRSGNFAPSQQSTDLSGLLATGKWNGGKVFFARLRTRAVELWNANRMKTSKNLPRFTINGSRLTSL